MICYPYYIMKVTLYLYRTSSAEVENFIKQLKHTASGYDKISTEILEIRSVLKKLAVQFHI